MYGKFPQNEDEFGYRDQKLNNDLIKSGEETRREMQRIKQEALKNNDESMLPQRKDEKH